MNTLKLGSKFRVIALQRTGSVTVAINDTKRRAANAVRAKLHAAVAAAFRWALAMPAVQQEIADAFDGSTPMCRVLRDAISSSHDHHREVEVDDVNGLNRVIDEAIEEGFRNFEIEADSIKNLDETVQAIIEDNTKDVAEAVAEHLTITVNRRR